MATSTARFEQLTSRILSSLPADHGIADKVRTTGVKSPFPILEYRNAIEKESRKPSDERIVSVTPVHSRPRFGTLILKVPQEKRSEKT